MRDTVRDVTDLKLPRVSWRARNKHIEIKALEAKHWNRIMGMKTLMCSALRSSGASDRTCTRSTSEQPEKRSCRPSA
jgi:hypothetical protein